MTVYDALIGDEYVPVNGTVTLATDIEGTVIWSSTIERVATVDENGTVTARRAGGAVVSCTNGNGSVTNVWCVYVYGPIEGDARVEVGQSTQLRLAGMNTMPQGAEAQTGWTWSLDAGSDSAVATVDQNDGTVIGHKPGTVTVVATRGSGQGQVSYPHAVEVTTASLANARVTIPRQTYSGQKLTPAPVVTLNGVTLVAGTDYDVVDQDIVNAGAHTITIQGKGIYQGKASGTFVVEPLRLTSPEAATGLVYDGSSQAGVPEGADYTLEGDVEEIDADEYSALAVVKDKANTCWEDYSAYCVIEWSIEPRSASEVSVEVLGSCVYDGSEHTPEPTVTWNGEELVADKDYTVSYENNVNAGTATVTITCEDGNFVGTKTATFSIVPAPAVVGTVTAADVRDSLDPADVELTRTDTSLSGRLALTETELFYGTNTYHWTFTPDDANYGPSSGTVEITVTGHEWGAPTYEWAKDDASCTARRVCANNPAHVEEETVIAVRTIVTKPTIKGEGKAIITAEFTNAAFETQSKEVVLPKLSAPSATGLSVSAKSDGPNVKTTDAPDATHTSDASGVDKKAGASGATRVPDTSDGTHPVLPIVAAGTIALVVEMLKRRALR